MQTGKQTYLNTQKGADREADIFKYPKGCRQYTRIGDWQPAMPEAASLTPGALLSAGIGRLFDLNSIMNFDHDMNLMD